MKSPKNWLETERPRERLLKNRPQILSDAQLLAIILRTGSDEKTVMDVAIDFLINLTA